MVVARRPHPFSASARPSRDGPFRTRPLSSFAPMIPPTTLYIKTVQSGGGESRSSPAYSLQNCTDRLLGLTKVIVLCKIILELHVKWTSFCLTSARPG